jgi:hypothetical protein
LTIPDVGFSDTVPNVPHDADSDAKLLTIIVKNTLKKPNRIYAAYSVNQPTFASLVELDMYSPNLTIRQMSPAPARTRKR